MQQGASERFGFRAGDTTHDFHHPKENVSVSAGRIEHTCPPAVEEG